jgi:hypothetical protein
MKEQRKIKIKDEPTYSSGRKITILASATKKNRSYFAWNNRMER